MKSLTQGAARMSTTTKENTMKANAKASKQGSALLVVLTIVVAMSALLTITVKGGLQQAFFATKLSDRVRAQLIAEAGANEAYTILKEDWDARLSDDEFPVTSFGGGTYDVTIHPTNDMASIRSYATYGTADELAILDVINVGSSTPGQDIDWSVMSNYTVVAGGEISWSGASQFLNGGALHSNGQFTRSGAGYVEGDVTSSTKYKSNGKANGIDGDVTAPVIQGRLANISGTASEEAVAQVQIPDIDLTPYYNEALANGEVYNGNLTISAGEDPAGGIMWVNGNLTISGNANFTGSYIATGDLSVSGNGTLTSVDGYPTLVSRDGDISFTGQKAVDGLIYAKTGDYKQTGGNQLNGQIVVKGNIKKAGNSMVGSHVNSPPSIPGDRKSVV